MLDENDNPPRFVQSSFQVSLPENLPPGVLYIGQASDPDLGENSTIHYSIDGKEPPPQPSESDIPTGGVGGEDSTPFLDPWQASSSITYLYMVKPFFKYIFIPN